MYTNGRYKIEETVLNTKTALRSRDQLMYLLNAARVEKMFGEDFGLPQHENLKRGFESYNLYQEVHHDVDEKYDFKYQISAQRVVEKDGLSVEETVFGNHTKLRSELELQNVVEGTLEK